MRRNLQIAGAALVAAMVLGACSGDDNAADTSSPPSTDTTLVPPWFDGDPCLLVSSDDLEALFPQGVPAAPATGPNRCTWPISPPTGTSSSELVMRPLDESFDAVVANFEEAEGQVSSLDGIGDRAVYVPARLVFEVAGTAYGISITYGEGIEPPGEPTTQDVLQRVAAAWASTL
jgi:hypothetical protein